MAYKVRLKRKDGRPLGRREWLFFRDLYNDGGGYTRTTERHATVFESKEEIYGDIIQGFMNTLGYDFEIEEV